MMSEGYQQLVDTLIMHHTSFCVCVFQMKISFVTIPCTS